ncbi:MAG: hypothetical protein AUJ74_02270 [Candidatus Omnitrophica bacterium CG1_02_44_16]|nr:MAG: hypothetical protein AUJ74_02270 [Candidatus Omnitrophica bacterium CG1_02_44_16]PIY82927.1 MAG: hypothetical protein COY78_04015 [Candidatus Omnitrophica bacterium CG_4_10_14_0_8_um_filter_44_12]PIZ84265.1 MAG: hypothetical protein COX96_04600 [Candidatus Omnitrophica bacterium CG_4_10_14_0_2_um_filter_44_9]
MSQVMDIYTKYIITTIAAIFVALVVWWFYRVNTLIDNFLKMGSGILEGKAIANIRIPFFYEKEVLKGSYKGRDVILGVVYSGLQGEFLPLPCIQMRLSESMGYNTNRLPNYADISKNFLVYKIKLSVPWGIFDKSYAQAFSKSYLVIALEKLLAISEDVERGRRMKDILK